jgi:putative flippase GtrA
MQQRRFYQLCRPLIPRFLWPLLEAHQELFCYVIFGGLTTLVNLALYYPLECLVGYLVANVLAWVGSVIFAFLTSKYYVFEDQDWSLGTTLRQAGGFAWARLLSLGLEEGMLFLFVETLHLHQGVVKLLAQVLVIIINFVASKLFIFRRKS